MTHDPYRVSGRAPREPVGWPPEPIRRGVEPPLGAPIPWADVTPFDRMLVRQRATMAVLRVLAWMVAVAVTVVVLSLVLGVSR